MQAGTGTGARFLDVLKAVPEVGLLPVAEQVAVVGHATPRPIVHRYPQIGVGFALAAEAPPAGITSAWVMSSKGSVSRTPQGTRDPRPDFTGLGPPGTTPL